LNISGLIRSVMNELQAAEPKALELKVGEVVKGMVLQLLSETDAIINIGGVQVRAKLETPLKPGEVTLLQVQPNNSSGQIVMKPLGASGVQIAEGSLADVLKNVGLPDTSTNRQIIQMLHQSGVSLTKDNVQSFSQLQSQVPASVPQEEWISSAVVAFQKGIPLSSETVTAVRQAINGPAFHETLQDLDVQMTKLLSEQPSISSLTKSAIETFKSIVALVKEASNGLVSQTASQQQLSKGEMDSLLTAARSGSQQAASQAAETEASGVAADGQRAARLAAATANAGNGQSTPPQPASSDSVAAARAGGTVTAASLTAQPMATPSSPDPLSGGTGSKTGNTNSFNTSAVPVQTDPDSAQPSKLGAGHTHAHMPSASSISASPASSLTGNPVTGAHINSQRPVVANPPLVEARLNRETSDKPIIGNSASTKQAAETAVRIQPNASTTQEAHPLTIGIGAPNEEEHWISKLMKSVGVEHENTIFKLPERIVLDGQFQSAAGLLDKDPLAPTSPLQEQLKTVDTLKSVLLMLVQSDDTPPALKEAAQQAVQQITGQQLLLNIDRNAMFSNITMFIPLINANGEQTAAIHIQSRKGARGEIDSNNCRLVFDLRMKALGDTMVDVQVVDRIVSLRVLNDQPFVQQLLEAYREEIAAGLSAVGYQFISLKCSPYPEKGQPVEESTTGSKPDANHSAQLQSIYGNKPYKGMDLRV
jgi:hypothetical protein